MSTSSKIPTQDLELTHFVRKLSRQAIQQHQKDQLEIIIKCSICEKAMPFLLLERHSDICQKVFTQRKAIQDQHHRIYNYWERIT